MMELVKSNNVSQNVTFISQVNSANEKSFFITKPIWLESPPIEELSHLKFLIRKYTSESLYEEVQRCEKQLADSLLSMRNEIWADLPFHCQRTINDRRQDIQSCIRPNYFKNANGDIIYLKGVLKNVKIFKDGQPATLNDLGVGSYQFLIGTDTIYCGPHSKPHHVASLMLRIREIKYSPTSPAWTAAAVQTAADACMELAMQCNLPVDPPAALSPPIDEDTTKNRAAIQKQKRLDREQKTRQAKRAKLEEKKKTSDDDLINDILQEISA